MAETMPNCAGCRHPFSYHRLVSSTRRSFRAQLVTGEWVTVCKRYEQHDPHRWVVDVECNCEQYGGQAKWWPHCPLHGERQNPRKPREDGSLAQESVDEEEITLNEGILADLTYLLTAEDARIVEAYLLGVTRGQENTNDAETTG